MKKIFLILISLFILIPTVDASTTTFTRTEENYLVPDGITVSDNNRQAVLKTPAVDATEKIYDFADLLTQIEEESLYNKVMEFINKTNYDAVIVTIDDNNKYDAANYADDFFDYNAFGIGSSRDGLLFLIDMDTREVYISTTGMAIKMYSDARIDSIIDFGFDYLTSGLYYDCFDLMLDRADYYYGLGIPSSNSNLEIDENGHASYVYKIPYFVVFLTSCFISFIVSAILYCTTRLKIKKQNAAYYIQTNDSNIAKKDIFVTTHTTRVRRQSESSSSSSGGGSSSFHSGSSGISHGGGGRHF